MPPHQTVEYSGAITDVFAHRFVLATAQGNILADLGPGVRSCSRSKRAIASR
jgi:hypothetical protein